MNSHQLHCTKNEETLNRKLHFLCSSFCEIINRRAPCRKRCLRTNHKPFINFEISRAIMTSVRLHDRYLKQTSEENKKNNKCVLLQQNAMKEYFSLWMKMKLEITKHSGRLEPFLSSETISSQRSLLNENERLMNDEQKIADTLNVFFFYYL